jgi:hypothetical protein
MPIVYIITTDAFINLVYTALEGVFTERDAI